MLETYIISCSRSPQLINHEVAKSIQKRKNTEKINFFKQEKSEGKIGGDDIVIIGSFLF